MAISGSPGARFAQALAAKDEATLRAGLADEIDFRGLTPGRAWEAIGPDATIEVLLGKWFEPSDEILSLEQVSEGADVADVRHVGYRFIVRNAGGDHVVEQQAYYLADGERITRIRLLCSGFRPIPDAAELASSEA